VSDIELFERVSSAVIRSQEITFEYRKLKSPGFEPRRVQPYHLGCIDQQWYLFGLDLEREGMRTFVLARMRAIRPLKTRFKRPTEFSITKHLNESLGVFTGTGRYKVRLKFDEFAGRLVSERQWHVSQRTAPLAGGGIELSMELTSLEEIERWVLSWGAHVQVLAPEELSQRIRQAAQAILAGF
jgi:predicted DNA-binding transcriptional regulator YafY